MSGITVQLVFAFVGTRVPYHMCEPAPVPGPAPVSPGSPLRSPFNNTTASSTSFNATAQSSLRVQSANSSPSLGPAAPRAPCTTRQLLTRLAAIAAAATQQATTQTPQEEGDEAEDPQQQQHPQLSPATRPESEEAPPGSEEALRSASPSPSNASSVTAVGGAAHRAPLLELFHYDTMAPLDGAAVLHDEDVLLVLCDADIAVELVEALQLEWMEAYSGTHRPHVSSSSSGRPLPTYTPTSATEMAVCTTEERLRNIAHARVALCKPVPLHMRLLEREFEECQATLKEQREHLRDLKAAWDAYSACAGGEDGASRNNDNESSAMESPVFAAAPSGVAERFPLLVELEPSLASVVAADADSVHSPSNEGSLLMCENQLASKEILVSRMSKQLAKLAQLAAEEEAKESRFASGAPTQALQAYLDGAEQDRDAASGIVKSFQAEMTRQLKSVRFLVAHITHLRNITKKTRREMGAVELVLSRLSMTLQRPRLLEAAEALLRRRVVLRRAARRQLLLLQETEYRDLQHDLDDFSQQREVQKVLPPKVRWYLRAPLPSLQPVEDVVATLLDHALIDRDVDVAQELVERTSFTPSSLAQLPEAAQTAQEIHDTLLPLERLVRRAEAAEASAAAYKAQVEALELKVKELEAQREVSSKSLDTAVTEAFPGSGAEEPLPSKESV